MRAENSTKDKPVSFEGWKVLIFMLQLFPETHFLILSSLSCKMERKKLGPYLPLFLLTLSGVFSDSFGKFRMMQKEDGLYSLNASYASRHT